MFLFFVEGFSAVSFFYRGVPRGTDQAGKQRPQGKLGDTEKELIVIPREFEEKTAVAKEHQHEREIQSVGDEILLFLSHKYVYHDTDRYQRLDRLVGESINTQLKIIDTGFPRITVTAARKDTAEVGYAVLYADQRSDIIAHRFVIELHDLADGIGKHRHPYEDAYDIVAAPLLEAGHHPIEKKHPYKTEQVYDNHKGDRLAERQLIVPAVQKSKDKNRNGTGIEENVVEQSIETIRLNRMHQLIDHNILRNRCSLYFAPYYTYSNIEYHSSQFGAIVHYCQNIMSSG